MINDLAQIPLFEFCGEPAPGIVRKTGCGRARDQHRSQEFKPESMGSFRGCWLHRVCLEFSAIGWEIVLDARHQWAGCSAVRGDPLRVAAPAMRRHASAHWRHASAKRLQCSKRSAWRSHSTAQSSQASAHKSQKSAARSLPRAMSTAAVRHSSAHSMSSSMQRASVLTSSSFKQAVAQWSHQARIHCRRRCTCAWFRGS